MLYFCIIVGDPIIQRGSKIPLPVFTHPYFYAFPMPEPGFPMSYVVVCSKI